MQLNCYCALKNVSHYPCFLLLSKYLAGNIIGQDKEFWVNDAREWHFDEQYIQFNYTLCIWAIILDQKTVVGGGKKTLMGMMDISVTVMWNLLLNCALTVFSLRIWRQFDNVKSLYCLQVHFPSMTVFKNFPGSTQSVLAQPQCLDFSPGSGYLAVGNNKGTALLYR